MVCTLRFSLQNAVCFIILMYLVPVLIHILYTVCAKIKKNNSGTKSLINLVLKTVNQSEKSGLFYP